MSDPEPVTPASAGHDRARELDVIARAERARGRDAFAWVVVKKLARTALLLAVPAFLVFAIAAPGFQRFPCRSKQSEARGNLKALYVATESYRAENDRYTSEVGALGFVPKGNRVRYDYFLRVDDTGFEGVAVGRTSDVHGDVWRITEQNTLEHVLEGCRR